MNYRAQAYSTVVVFVIFEGPPKNDTVTGTVTKNGAQPGFLKKEKSQEPIGEYL